MPALHSCFRLPLIHLRPLGLAFCGLMLIIAGVIRAEDAVPIPRLPEGAGPVDENAPKTFTATESGLKYRILRASKGAKPSPMSRVEVNYHGWIIGNRVFDSSYLRGGPVTLGLTQVVKGWAEGMQKVGKGGMIELEIPGYLGYGLAGQPSSGIPPNATLHFIVELIEILD